MSESSFSPEVIIIGASLAGSAATIELARSGRSVLLLDKCTFPRRKPCGEGLSSRGRAELLRLGIEAREIHEIGLELRGYRIDRNGSMIELVDSSGLVGVAREALDHSVLQRAISYPSALFHIRARVSKVTSR